MRKLTEGYVPAYMAGWNECVDEYKCLLDEAKAELMLAETSVADKCIQIDELQDSYTALVEAVRLRVANNHDSYCPAFKYLFAAEIGECVCGHDALAKLIGTKGE